MISNQIIQTSIDELRGVAKMELCVMDTEGGILASTCEESLTEPEVVQSFAISPADSQEMRNAHLFKIYVDKQLEYILAVRGMGSDVYILGKMAACQIKNLAVAYKERYDKNNFIQNLLLDNLLLIDIYNRAKKLHIEVEARRVVFVIEVKNEGDNSALETMKNMFSDRNHDFVTQVDEQNIVLVKELKEKENYESLEQTAALIVDMLNTEAMTSARVAYGTIVSCLREVSKSYKEAKMSLDVGKIFYSEKSIVAYNTLGIGRLIYQLPVSLCEMFIKEVFDKNLPDSFDEETISTINKFFENNLNVSETARQLYVHRNTLVYRLEKLQKSTGLDIRVFEDALTFKIALMVDAYMKYQKDLDG